MLKIYLIIIFLLTNFLSYSQIDFKKPFKDCKVEGSITLFDYQNKKWIYSDSSDALKETLPASTFKIINSLIALEEGLIADENEVIKWIGLNNYNTSKYANRPETFKDMNLKEALEISALQVYIEFAKKIGVEKYKKYLALCNYGNGIIDENNKNDFWVSGRFGITPKNQVEFLIKLYEDKLPFSKRNMDIVKRIMITETQGGKIMHAKTGWAQYGGNDIGWWVGYEDKSGKITFFATRLIKKLEENNDDFASCRKKITKEVLKQINVFD